MKMALKLCIKIITVCVGEGGTYRLYMFCTAILLKRVTFSQAATASALTISSELLSAFAEGEDPLSDLWRCWC